MGYNFIKHFCYLVKYFAYQFLCAPFYCLIRMKVFNYCHKIVSSKQSNTILLVKKEEKKLEAKGRV